MRGAVLNVNGIQCYTRKFGFSLSDNSPSLCLMHHSITSSHLPRCDAM